MEKTDLEDFFEYASVDGVGQMAGWLPHKNIEETQKILDMFIEEKKVFAIEYNGKVIGSLGIEKYNEEKLPELESLQGREIGYVLSKDYWGHGFMSEAVRCVINYLFNELSLDFLICGYFVRNNCSYRVQEKCGFKFYKKEKYDTSYGTIEDEILTIMFKDESEISK